MRVLWISALVVGLDQLTKAAVLHFMVRQQSIPILGDWLKFTFTENPGMAFGIQFGPRGLVTFLSVGATLLVIYYMYQVRGGYTPYRASLALILGGAIGNIIDRVFYGVLLGYGDLFVGKVVDFIHVSLWQGFVPEIFPFVGGAYMELFPIWNVADMAIVLGVVGILYFQKTFHERLYEKQVAEMGEDPPDWERSSPPETHDMHSGAHDADEPASDTETESASPEGRSENIAHRASSSSLAPSSPSDRSSMQGSSSDGAK